MHIVLTIPPGIWSGIIAYRTNSMLPPMLAHMISNLIAFILSRRSHNLASIDPDYFFLFDPVRIVIFCISLASFAISIVLLVRGRWDETSTETECKPIEAEAPKT